jgi:FMN phosphatase YigB (HAD superfamily)
VGLILCVALDYGGTISGDDVDHEIGCKPLSPAGRELITTLSAKGFRLVLASNTLPDQPRDPALEAAGVTPLFAAVLQSHLLGVMKPDPRFFDHVVNAAECPADQILYVGNNPRTDGFGPVAAGMWAAVLGEHEHLPPRAVTIRALPEVLGLLERLSA